MTSGPQPGWLRFDDRARLPAAARAQQLAARALTTCYRRAFFLTYAPKDVGGVPAFRCALRVEFGGVSEHDAAAYHAFRPQTSADEVRRRLRRGDRCFAAWQGDAITAAGWAATGVVEVPYLEARLALAPTDVYHYDLYTAPGARGRGLLLAVTAYAVDWHRRAGFRRSVGVVAPENVLSWSAFHAAGVVPRGTYTYLRLGPLRRHWRHSADGTPLPIVLPSPSHSEQHRTTAQPYS